MVDFKDVEKINKLAKALKDSKLAATMDEAVKMAKDILKKGDKSIEEMKEKESTPGTEELIEEEPGFIEKAKDVFEKREEIPHAVPSKKEVVKEIEEEVQEIREEIKRERKEKDIKSEKIKEKVEEVEEEEKVLEKEEKEKEEE